MGKEGGCVAGGWEVRVLGWCLFGPCGVGAWVAWVRIWDLRVVI